MGEKEKLSKKIQKKNNGTKAPWTFPKHTLEDSIRVAQAIEEKYAGNPMPAQDLAIAVGFRQAQDWRFKEFLRSAAQYGLINGAGISAPIRLEPIGQNIIAPGSPQERSEALVAAFRNVKHFAEVESFYNGKKIPDNEFFLNTLTKQFAVQRDRVEHFAKVYTENLKYLRSFAAVPANVSSATTTTSSVVHLSSSGDDATVPKEPRVSLDTCFVMMPFGQWFDRYYQEIYVPAIREAGFEPVRGDELFTTGSVVEQIWDQIEKSKILLADLTGKNPNVFYELGLAHAARKPVVFTAADIQDVPFDLRHLRVITYEIREPDWAQTLRKNITDYLRNAAKEPLKAIPHPFRRLVEEESGGGVRKKA